MKMEDSWVEKGREICNVIESLLVNNNKKFIFEKFNLYCKYCLSLNKDFVNSIANDFYEECEDYFKKLENEQTEKQLNLALEGKEKMIDMGNMRLKGI